MAIHKLTFDTTEKDSSANVGAYLRSSDGTLLTHTTLNGTDEALDVNIANSTIAVTSTQLDVDDLNATDDNVASWTHDGTGTAITSTVVASDTGLDINVINASLTVDDGGTSLTVDAVQLDIDDLNATDDAVASWLHDGTGNEITSSAGALDVNIQSSDIEIDVEDDKADTAIETKAYTPGATTGLLVSSVLANRRFIWLVNNGSKDVFIGESGVTLADGFPLYPGSILEARLGPSIPIHSITTAGFVGDVRTLQAS